ncbi:hypothetical protein ES288_D03G093700v1 [Gossypium darwinii]|uniref:Uncharacterized protein n=1 Tax=Gossypium darwinii TaxID=34276 RepID=A0A5D2D527_GOSDA|nr:hypothetical protein ES288_D03G093700v1 [Gossypium darwinii]
MMYSDALRPIIPDNACILCITAATGTELADAYSPDTVIASFPGKEVHDLWAFYLHAALLRQAFAHCGKFPTAASRRSLGRVSVPVLLIILSDQLLIIALTRAPPRADSSFCSSAYGVLAAVSSCCSPPKGRFLRVTHPSATGNTTSRLTCMSSLFVDKTGSDLSFIPRHNLQNRKTHIGFRDNQARTDDFHHVKAFLSHYYGYENNGKSWIQLSTAPIRNRIDYGFEPYTHDLTIFEGTGVTSLFQFHSRVLMCFHDPLRPRNFDKFLFFS